MAVKKTNNKKLFFTIAILMIILLVLCGVRLISNMNGGTIKSRVKDLEKYNKEEKTLQASSWLRVQGTNIDYPVLNSKDQEEYQERDDIQYLWASGNLQKDNKIIYILGHNIMNLSKNPLITEKEHVRFEQLMSFTYYDFAKNNEYIQLTIDGEDYLYKIFSVSYPLSYETETFNVDGITEEFVEEYIDRAKEESIYDYDVDVNKDDQIISLITCTRMFNLERNFQVTGRLVRKGESTRNYKVKTTDAYKEVENQMKGENENDKEA